MRELRSSGCPHSKAIRLPSGEYAREDASQGIAFSIGIDLPAESSTFSIVDELPEERTSAIDRLSGANVRLPIFPLSKCPCVPFHCHPSDATPMTATMAVEINNSLRRGPKPSDAAGAFRSVSGIRFSRYLRIRASIAKPIRNHQSVPKMPQSTTANEPYLTLVNRIPNAGNEIGRSATNKIIKRTPDGPSASAVEKSE